MSALRANIDKFCAALFAELSRVAVLILALWTVHVSFSPFPRRAIRFLQLARRRAKRNSEGRRLLTHQEKLIHLPTWQRLQQKQCFLCAMISRRAWRAGF